MTGAMRGRPLDKRVGFLWPRWVVELFLHQVGELRHGQPSKFLELVTRITLKLALKLSESTDSPSTQLCTLPCMIWMKFGKDDSWPDASNVDAAIQPRLESHACGTVASRYVSDNVLNTWTASQADTHARIQEACVGETPMGSYR